MVYYDNRIHNLFCHRSAWQPYSLEASLSLTGRSRCMFNCYTVPYAFLPYFSNKKLTSWLYVLSSVQYCMHTWSLSHTLMCMTCPKHAPTLKMSQCTYPCPILKLKISVCSTTVFDMYHNEKDFESFFNHYQTDTD